MDASFNERFSSIIFDYAEELRLFKVCISTSKHSLPTSPPILEKKRIQIGGYVLDFGGYLDDSSIA
jgi:hypothetical protein